MPVLGSGSLLLADRNKNTRMRAKPTGRETPQLTPRVTPLETPIKTGLAVVKGKGWRVHVGQSSTLGLPTSARALD